MKFMNVHALPLDPVRDMNRIARIAEELWPLIPNETFSLTSISKMQTTYQSSIVRRVLIHLCLKGKLRKLPAGLFQKVETCEK